MNEDFLKNSQNWPLGGAPGGGGQKFYQKVISYSERVLLSKFGENRMKKKDFLKNAKNWPPGGTPEGGGAKFFWTFFFKYRDGPSVQISWRFGTRNKSFFTNHCKGGEEEEEELKRIWNPAAQGKKKNLMMP